MSGPEVSVLDVLERRAQEERQTAVRTLLRHPLLTSTEPDAKAFVLVRRHARWLRDWFSDNAGWSLHVERDVARLRKVVADPADATRPAVADGSGAPFSRRRYALLCLALAALERADAQVTLGQLAERVLALASEPALASAGLVFTLGTREDRLDLAAVVRLLQHIAVLVRVAGDELDFVNQSGDALYDVERRALAGLLVSTRGPSLINTYDFAARLDALREDRLLDSDDARRRTVRHALTRRLLDDPIIYVAELDDDEQAYLTSQRPHLVRRVLDATGWQAEVRAEGIALLDPSGEATDLRMPEEGTDGHATLLIAEYLADVLRRAPSGTSRVPLAELHAQMQRWAAEHRAHWRKAATEPGAELGLCRLALRRLEGLGLVRVRPDGVEPRAALARYAYAPAVLVTDQLDQAALL